MTRASELVDGDRDLNLGTPGSEPVLLARTRRLQGHLPTAVLLPWLLSPGLPRANLRVARK